MQLDADYSIIPEGVTPSLSTSSGSADWGVIGKAISDIGSQYIQFRTQTAAQKYAAQADAARRAYSAPYIPSTGGISGNVLLIGGLALAAIIVISMLRKG